MAFSASSIDPKSTIAQHLLSPLAFLSTLTSSSFPNPARWFLRSSSFMALSICPTKSLGSPLLEPENSAPSPAEAILVSTSKACPRACSSLSSSTCCCCVPFSLKSPAPVPAPAPVPTLPFWLSVALVSRSSSMVIVLSPSGKPTHWMVPIGGLVGVSLAPSRSAPLPWLFPSSAGSYARLALWSVLSLALSRRLSTGSTAPYPILPRLFLYCRSCFSQLPQIEGKRFSPFSKSRAPGEMQSTFDVLTTHHQELRLFPKLKSKYN